MFYLAGISIAIFLSLILFSKRSSNLADRILATWLIVDAIHLYFFYAGITGTIYAHPWLLGTHLPIPLLHGPFLFLYAAAQTGKLTKWNTRAWIHFLPVFVNYVYLIHYFILPAGDKIWVYQNRGQGYEVYMLLNNLAIVASGVGYVIATSVLLNRHRRSILQEFSTTDRINLRWIQYLTYGISVIWLLVIFGNDNLVFTAAVLFVVFIGYFGIKQVGVFTLNPSYTTRPSWVAGLDADSRSDVDTVLLQPVIVEEEREADGSTGKKKYSKSGLSEEMALEIHQQLKSLMATGRVYVESELTLTELSDRLMVHPNHLSQVINDREGLNFYDYINNLRVQDFISRLPHFDHRRYTLLGLAFECGFNSKSTFNKHFRKVTGVTPSVYLRQIKPAAGPF